MDLIHKIESLRYDIENGVETDVIKISVRLIQIKEQALQLQQTGVIRSAFAVIPDAERLGIGSNKIIAVFKHKHQAEAWAKGMWENIYIIEEVKSEHFL